MQLTFNSNAKPYSNNDKVKEKYFNEIVNDYAYSLKKNINEEIIQRVFECYASTVWHAELIVRVPELYAFYSNDLEKIRNVRSSNAKLFDFFGEIQLFIKQRIIEMKLKKRVKLFNEICGLKDEILRDSENFNFEKQTIQLNINFLVSNSLKMTFIKVVQNQIDDHRICCCRINNLESKKALEVLQEIQKMNIRSILIIYCDQKVDEDKFREIINKFNMQVIFIVDQESKFPQEFPSLKIEHKMDEIDLVNLASDIKVNFQGVEIKIKYTPNEIYYLRRLPITALTSENLIIIGKPIKEFKDFYYPRKFLNSKNKIKDIEDLYTEEVILLSDEPGMGKSTTLRKVSFDLKSKYPEKWVLYIDLKLYLDTFKKFRNDTSDVIEVFSHMMRFKTYEKDFFSFKLRENCAILLFDGIDEISPDFKDFIVNFITNVLIEFKNVQIWIASRPHCVKELTRNLKISPYKLSPIMQKDFLKQYFKFNDTCKDDQEKILKCVDFVRTEWNQEYENPLIIRIALEIFNQIEEDLNLYSFYKIYLKKKFNIVIDGEGKGELRRNDFLNVAVKEIKLEEFHQKMSIKLLLKRLGVDWEKFKNLEVMQIENPVDAIFGFGILYGNSYDECFFSHQTFLEYFVANYIVANVFENASINESENILRIKVLWLVMTDDSNKQIQKFIEHYLKEKDTKKIQINLTAMFELFKKDVFHFLKEVNSTKFVSCFFSLHFAHLKHFHLFHSLLISCLDLQIENQKKIPKLLEEILTYYQQMLGLESAKKLLLQILNYNNEMLKLKVPSLRDVINGEDESACKLLLAEIKKIFSKDEIKTLIASHVDLFYKLSKSIKDVLYNFLDDIFELRKAYNNHLTKIINSENFTDISQCVNHSSIYILEFLFSTDTKKEYIELEKKKCLSEMFTFIFEKYDGDENIKRKFNIMLSLYPEALISLPSAFGTNDEIIFKVFSWLMDYEQILKFFSQMFSDGICFNYNMFLKLIKYISSDINDLKYSKTIQKILISKVKMEKETLRNFFVSSSHERIKMGSLAKLEFKIIFFLFHCVEDLNENLEILSPIMTKEYLTEYSESKIIEAHNEETLLENLIYLSYFAREQRYKQKFLAFVNFFQKYEDINTLIYKTINEMLSSKIIRAYDIQTYLYNNLDVKQLNLEPSE